MINFIVCDDDKKSRTEVEKTITSYMMKNQIQYKTHFFDDYNDDFLKIIDAKLSFKIYILDIETPSRSGIDVAKMIRKKDIQSMIIFLTGHGELGEIVLKKDLFFLAFINKFDNCKDRLTKVIDKALKMADLQQVLRFKSNGVVYSLSLDNILYIFRDTYDRKCIIKTDYAEFKVNKGLKDLKKLLNNDFVQCHRACLINLKRVATIDRSKKEIIFDNGSKTHLISTKYSKELINV